MRCRKRKFILVSEDDFFPGEEWFIDDVSLLAV